MARAECALRLGSGQALCSLSCVRDKLRSGSVDDVPLDVVSLVLRTANLHVQPAMNDGSISNGCWCKEIGAKGRRMKGYNTGKLDLLGRTGFDGLSGQFAFQFAANF